MLSCLARYKDFISIESIPKTTETQIFYKEFGIMDSGYYLIRPDSYIALRSKSFNQTSLEKYLKENLKLSEV